MNKMRSSLSRKRSSDMEDLPDHTLVTMAMSKYGYHEKLNLRQDEYQIYPSKHKIIFKSSLQSVSFKRDIVKQKGYRQRSDKPCYYFIQLGKTNNEIAGEGEIRFRHEDMRWFNDWIERRIKGEGQDQQSGSKGKTNLRATKSAGSAMTEEPSKRYSMTKGAGPPRLSSPETKKRSRFKLFLHHIGRSKSHNKDNKASKDVSEITSTSLRSPDFSVTVGEIAEDSGCYNNGDLTDEENAQEGGKSDTLKVPKKSTCASSNASCNSSCSSSSDSDSDDDIYYDDDNDDGDGKRWHEHKTAAAEYASLAAISVENDQDDGQHVTINEDIYALPMSSEEKNKQEIKFEFPLMEDVKNIPSYYNVEKDVNVNVKGKIHNFSEASLGARPKCSGKQGIGSEKVGK